MNYININLSHNQFRQVKIDEVELFLYSNQLTSIPAEIGNLQKLKNLYLETNQLTSIPAEIGANTKFTIIGFR